MNAAGLPAAFCIPHTDLADHGSRRATPMSLSIATEAPISSVIGCDSAAMRVIRTMFEFAARAHSRQERLEKRIPLLRLGVPYSVVVRPSEILRSMAVRSLRNEDGKSSPLSSTRSG